MKKFLYDIMDIIAYIHNKILSLNDAYEVHFSDKQLHFLVIGFFGMLIFFVVHPLFSYLAKKRKVMVISWLYVFTLVIVLTFAIEIGQQLSHTGNMEFADIMFGLVGFLFMFAVFILLRWIFRGILWALRRIGKRSSKKNETE